LALFEELKEVIGRCVRYEENKWSRRT